MVVMTPPLAWISDQKEVASILRKANYNCLRLAILLLFAIGNVIITGLFAGGRGRIAPEFFRSRWRGAACRMVYSRQLGRIGGSAIFRRRQVDCSMVDIAKLRWRIERDYQELKQEVGLGHFGGADGAAFIAMRRCASRPTAS